MKRVIHFFLAGGLLLGTSCSKDKQDISSAHLPDEHNNTKSSVRLIMPLGSTDLQVNDTRLTDWVSYSLISQALPKPTPYFPVTGKFSGTYFIPQQFMNAQGQATVKIVTAQSNGDQVQDSFVVQDNYAQPLDYYLSTSADPVPGGIYTYSAVPRATAAPAAPSSIRVRVVNLANNLDGGATNHLTLTYADGSPVSAATSGVGPRAVSDYVEIPYGTYQFKLLIDGTTRQVPGKAPQLLNLTSSSNYALGATQVYYAPVQSYLPGGVYTILVSLISGSYQFGDSPVTPNCFQVITDIAPGANLTYGRVQAVNAADETGLQWQVDADSITTIAYGNASAYRTLIAGRHMLTVKDAKGKTVSTQTFTLYSGDNLSFWAWPGNADSVRVTRIQNNMGGIRSTQLNSDGSDVSNGIYDPLKFDMIRQTRFLNFCPDFPYITFTGANGALFAKGIFSDPLAAQNLQPGQAPDARVVSYPYVNLGYNADGTVQAYSSRPQVLPGDRLTAVTPLGVNDFVHMPLAYANGNVGTEPGVYTVALIGRNDATHHPRLIVVKHNQ